MISQQVVANERSHLLKTQATVKQRCWIKWCLPLVLLFCSNFIIHQLFADNQFIKPDTLIIVSDDNYPPYIFRDDQGKLQGILVDQWRLWEQKTGIKAKLIATDWSQAQHLMKEGKADVIETMFETPERRSTYLFSKPYAKIEVPVFYHNTLSGITNANTLQGFSIGVKAGDACIEVLKRSGLLFFQEFASYEKVLEAAQNGQIKVFCIDKEPAIFLLNKNNLENEFREGFVLYTGEFHRAVVKGQHQLLSLVEKGFEMISKEESKRITDKWMGKSLGGGKTLKYLTYALLLAAAIALFFVGNWWMLRRRVQARTLQLQIALNKLTESETHYRLLVQNAMEAIYVVYNGIILYGNKSFADLAEIPVENVVGAKLFSFLKPEDVEFAKLRYKQIESGKLFSGRREAQMMTKKGTKWVLVNSVAITWDQKRAVLSFASDITEIKQVEEDLRIQNHEYQALNEEYISLNEQLQHTINQMQKVNDDLIVAKAQAELSDRLKTAFLANISHEVRTPLNGIVGFAELLTQESLTPEKTKAYFSQIDQNCQRLLNTVSDIVEASLLQTHQVKLYPTSFNLHDFLKDACLQFETSLSPHKHIFSLALNPEKEALSIEADQAKLKQIVRHLLENAQKFTPSGTINLGYSLDEKHLVLYVKDTGIGIAENHLQSVFEPFTQVETQDSAKTSGAGLGLSLCKGLAELMGGYLKLESTLGQGTTVYLGLPLKLAQNPVVNKTLVSKPKALPKQWLKVLLAEDESSNFEFVKMALQGTDIHLFHATNGAVAVEMVKTHPNFNLVLMDIKMPVMDGVEALYAIRELNPDLPVVALTAYAMAHDEDRIRNAGFDGYYLKPIRRADLLESINRNAKLA
jgi:PAS domain S-box-containing protein